LTDINQFSKFVTGALPEQLALKQLLNILPHRSCVVVTLLCEN